MVETIAMLIAALVVAFVLSLIGIFARSSALRRVSVAAMVLILVALIVEIGNFAATTAGAPPGAFYALFTITLVYVGILLLAAIG